MMKLWSKAVLCVECCTLIIIIILIIVLIIINIIGTSISTSTIILHNRRKFLSKAVLHVLTETVECYTLIIIIIIIIGKRYRRNGTSRLFQAS